MNITKTSVTGATGTTGGCNTGYLASWGGNLHIETGADADNGIG